MHSSSNRQVAQSACWNSCAEMVWILGAAFLILVIGYNFHLFARGDIPGLVRSLRYTLGGVAVAAAALLGLTGRIGIASMLGLAGSTILMRGRLGPIDFTTAGTTPGAKSRVRSHYFDMELDHNSGEVQGKVVAGSKSGSNLIDIGEDDMRDLIGEVAHDPDSLALLESWLDANRSGWREYFGYGTSRDQDESASAQSHSSEMDEEQAFETLGLKRGATAEDIKAAHRRLLKAAHPDHGGSAYLAARINAARDFLLKKT